MPAYNEAERLNCVLEALRSANLIDETIVVNDGSYDDTYAVASQCSWVRPLNLEKNRGKGSAMRAGAEATDADIVLFLDADLLGITGDQIDSLVTPVIDGQMDMCIGIFCGGRKLTDWAQVIAPFISGQRALKREVFLQMPEMNGVRSGVEVAITRYFRSKGMKIGTVPLAGCTHFMKEEKMGWVRGSAARLRMYYDIVKTTFAGSRFVK